MLLNPRRLVGLELPSGKYFLRDVSRDTDGKCLSGLTFRLRDFTLTLSFLFVAVQSSSRLSDELLQVFIR